MKKIGPIHVLIADPRQLMCEGLRHMLQGRTQVTTAPDTASEAELLETLAASRADVVLLNPRWGMHGGPGFIEKLRRAAPALPILVLASDADSDDPVALLKAGAKGYVSKDCGPADLYQAVLKVALGGLYVSHELGELIAADLYTGVRGDGYSQLSPREAQVFGMLARGHTVSQIGAALGLSVKTVSTHKSRMMERLGLASLSELVQYALSHNLIGQDAPPAPEEDGLTDGQDCVLK